MTFRLLTSTIALIAAVACASAQSLLLPSPHNSQHLDLLANQHTLTNQLRQQAGNRLMQDALSREAAPVEFDEDLFGHNWESTMVNAYAGLTVPAHANIDVSDFAMPLSGKPVLTSNYGYRPRFGRVHHGTDFSLRTGDTVYAAFTGKVRLTKYEGRGYGYYVVVRHPNGLETVYGHLSRFLVKPDQWVQAGEPIALGGNTGRSTGPHLHFETRYMGMPINSAAIIDWDNQRPHSDVFAFNKATCEKSSYAGKYTPKKRKAQASSTKKKKRSTASTKARTSKKKKRR